MNRACSRVSKTGSDTLGCGVGFSVLLPREQPKFGVVSAIKQALQLGRY